MKRLITILFFLGTIWSRSLGQTVYVENFSHYGLTNQGTYLQKDVTFGKYQYKFVAADSDGIKGFARAIGIDGSLQVGGFEYLNEFSIVDKQSNKFSFNGMAASTVNGGPVVKLKVSGYKHGKKVTADRFITVDTPSPGKFYDFSSYTDFYNVDEVRFSSADGVEFIIEHWAYREMCQAAVSVAGDNQEICDSFATLSANTPEVGSGHWSLISGSANIVDPLNPATTVTDLGSGTNKFMWTVINGTCDTATSVTKVIHYEQPDVAFAGSDFDVCSSQTTMHAASPAVGTGFWTSLDESVSISDSSNAKTAISGLKEGQNIFVWTVTNGPCLSSSDTVTVKRWLEPTIADAGVDQTICTSETYLDANYAISGKGKWTVKSGQATIEEINNPKSMVSNIGEGIITLTWEISNGPCLTSVSTVTITRLEAPTVALAGDDQSTCLNSAVLSANQPEVGTGKWTKLSGDATVADTADPGSAVNGLSLVENLFVWSISNGICQVSSDTVSISYDPISINAGSDIEATKGEQVTLGKDMQIDPELKGEFQWDPAELLDNPYMENPSTNLSNTTMFTVSFTTAEGCKAMDSVKVNVTDPTVAALEETTLQIPKGISPNGDGINDSWVIKGLEIYPNNSVQIFNRWGQMVYEKQKYGEDQSFDGIGNKSSSSQRLPEDTYFYNVFLGNNTPPVRGYLVIRYN